VAFQVPSHAVNMPCIITRPAMSRVDLRIDAGELAGTFDHMRIWLDRRDCVPVMFDPIGNQNGTLVLHVDFEEDALADAFRQEFGGAGRGPPDSKLAVETITLAGLRRFVRKRWPRLRR
jgi:hypothetical protein